MISAAGNNNENARSDCHLTIELTNSGGIALDINSKVNTLYGKANKELIAKILRHFKVENAKIRLEDRGALPFVIAARLEAAIKKLIVSKDEYLPADWIKVNEESLADRIRTTRLYIPGNHPRLMINAAIHNADGIILDLEDSVSPEKKEEARFLVRNALRSLDFMGSERMVRINQGELGLEDLDSIIPHNPNLILVPKCENFACIEEVNKRISVIQDDCKIRHKVWLMPIIESPLGILNLVEILKSSENIVAAAIGLEDYTAELGVKRSNDQTESFYARGFLVNTCKALNIQPIDSVFSDFSDERSLLEAAKSSRALGFEGMGCIHPRQISVIKEGFRPNELEISYAQEILLAFDQATAVGKGVVALGSKMIDAPIVKKAQQTIEKAIAFDQIKADWRNN
jgi:citrate lyase subunit beta/citryl-CoA lyase